MFRYQSLAPRNARVWLSWRARHLARIEWAIGLQRRASIERSHHEGALIEERGLDVHTPVGSIWIDRARPR